MASVKNLQALRDLLQNVHSQRPGIAADLAALDAKIATTNAALAEHTAARDKLVAKLQACDQAKAELPSVKRELAEAIEAEEARKAVATK